MENSTIIGVDPMQIGQQAQSVVLINEKRFANDTFSQAKRVVDVVVALMLLLFLLPLFLVLAVLVRRDGSPAIYGQKRLGQSGRSFTLWKLRSMVPDAERILAGHLQRDPQALAQWEANQKLTNDPRVTPLGRILRKYSLDEIPQFFNVLCGDMSLVGPRPMMLDQEQLYPGLAYAGLRPGLTGLWQISERDDATFAARAGFDAKYAANLSLREDLRIAFHTLGYLVGGRGR